MREDVYHNIGEPNLKRTDVRLLGFGRSCISPRGYFTTHLTIDKDDFETDFYVVSNDVMKFPIMLGNDLEQAELIVSRNGVQILKFKPDTDLPMAAINYIEEAELDIGENVGEGERRKIKKLVEEYTPNKIKDTNVETVIVVKDNEPSCTPRRHPPAERKIIDNQVREWIEKKIVEPCTSEYASPVVVAWKKDGSPKGMY